MGTLIDTRSPFPPAPPRTPQCHRGGSQAASAAEVPEGRVTRWSLSQAISSLANESSHDRAHGFQRAAVGGGAV